MGNNRARHLYSAQKSTALLRNIPFQLTFEEWYDWWLNNGIDKDQVFGRQTKNTLCMCRYNDQGPYSLSNIYCDTMANNSSDARKFNPKKGKIPTKRCHTPLGDFDSCISAANALNISASCLDYRLKSKFKIDYYYL